ncbi:LacI family transcriptional regulator [Antribacter sp. KLBMP9083]|uniref:LacI family transcriptional regulator n=1 Tax=Antribacter soli TaxID=2910976 RepID=A0AA41U4Z3_9MICO|nr:LacI family DNA-binding transcriptional regulator [Antribacter soli]MCF4119488.1 LacI family transcriptional regulator [Antribacter soli]
MSSDGPITLSQVAREAGVSLATASRAINGSATRTVRADLRERVLEAARRLDYSPDPSAQAMARGRTAALGLVVHDISDPYFSAIAAGVAAAAEREGLIVTLASTGLRPARELAFVELVRRQRARAVILAGGRLLPDDGDPAHPSPAHPRSAVRHEGGTQEYRSRDDVPNGGTHGVAEAGALVQALETFRRSGGGVAVVGQAVGELPVVEIANAQGAADLARALHGLGYRRFGVLAGPLVHRTAVDRAEGFVGALHELGCEVVPEDVVACAFTRDGGYTAMAGLLARTEPALPELVFAVNDVMAVGAMAAVRDAGRRVPDDVAVAGFDDIHTLRDVTPALTTVHVPLERIGELATRLALGLDAGEDADTGRVTVQGEVVLRESTPPLPPR